MTNEEHIEQLKNIGCSGWTVTADAYESLKWAIEALKQEPRQKGKWIHPYEYGTALPEHYCSECKTYEYSDVESNFCSSCGADMREGE